MPNIAGTHHPRFGPPDREPGPIVAPRVIAAGLRPCPRCADGFRPRDHYCRSCGFDVSVLAPLPPEGRTVGVWTTPGAHGNEWYRPLTIRTFALRAVLSAVAICAVAIAGISVMISRDLTADLPWPIETRGATDWASIQSSTGTLAVVQFGLLVLATVLLISWTRRAYRNLPALDVTGCRLAPRWATIGWLIPGVNLFVPKRILDDTWRASDPAALPWTDGWQRTSVPTPNHLWMVCSLVALPVVVLLQLQLSIFGTLPPGSRGSVHDAQTLYLILAVAEVLLVLACALMGRVVGTIHERQLERARVLGPAEPIVPAPAVEVAAADPAVVTPLLVRAANSERIGRY